MIYRKKKQTRLTKIFYMYIASTEKCDCMHLGLARKLRPNYASCLILWLRVPNNKPSHATGRRHQLEFYVIVTVSMTVNCKVSRNIHQDTMPSKWRMKHSHGLRERSGPSNAYGTKMAQLQKFFIPNNSSKSSFT